MWIMSDSRLRVVFAAVCAVGLVACGGGQSPVESDTQDPQTLVESQVPMPTVTPNAAPLESGHPNSIQPETTVNISAEGSVTREPDIAFLNAGVQTDAETAQAAVAANASAMNRVFSALEASGIAKRDMQTSNFSVQPQYDYSNRDGSPPRLTGYQATNQLTVKVRDLTTLGETMDAMVGAGGNTFSGLSFALENDRDARNEARALAMREAISRAELYASASGYEVARVVTISESSDYRPQPMAMAMARSRDMAESTPIASGEVGYSVTVNVVFELRKPAE